MAFTLNLFSAQAFPLAASPVVPQTELDLHSHDCTELVFVTNGGATHRLEHESFPIEKGDVFVVPVGMQHGYGNCRELHIMNVVFDPRRLALPEHQLLQLPAYRALFSMEPRVRVLDRFASRLKLDGEALAESLRMVELLRARANRKEPGFEIACVGLLSAVLVELSLHYARMTTPQTQALVRVASLVEWLAAHFAEPLTLEELAQHAHMSKSTLGRSFQECFGISPMNYLTDLRLKHAEHLLRDTKIQIRDIAPSVGILDASYFARLFRKHAGLEPSAYREQMSTAGRGSEE